MEMCLLACAFTKLTSKVVYCCQPEGPLSSGRKLIGYAQAHNDQNTRELPRLKINVPVANGSPIGALCIPTTRLSYRYDSYRPVRAYRNNKL